ncbi:MAG: helix-turn-helix transcriptional regulator, partial [Ruminococcus sp.]|nr:helix-turn-helix transcriptional regulator [Ruminococcus sp.]
SLFDSIDPERRLMRPYTDRPLGRQNLYYMPDIESTLRELAYYEGDDYGRTLLFTARLAAVMDKLGQQTANRPTAESTLSEQLVRYVNDMLCEDITVERLAEHFFLSASQFSRLFKESTGASPWAYITAKRLVRARELLQDGMSAKKAAEECGFKDYSVFYRAYVKRFGYSPCTTPLAPQRTI